MKWTEDDTYKFVGLYCDYECFWNISSANYKNKHMRQRAIEAIMQAMGREEFAVTEVKQKIKNIQSTYNQEVQKIQEHKTSGTSPDDEYKPTVKWFDVMDQIMKGSKGRSETQSNLVSKFSHFK
jgi:vacuolar-type H+-ATPase subunit E/Vma4